MSSEKGRFVGESLIRRRKHGERARPARLFSSPSNGFRNAQHPPANTADRTALFASSLARILDDGLLGGNGPRPGLDSEWE